MKLLAIIFFLFLIISVIKRILKTITRNMEQIRGTSEDLIMPFLKVSRRNMYFISALLWKVDIAATTGPQPHRKKIC